MRAPLQPSAGVTSTQALGLDLPSRVLALSLLRNHSCRLFQGNKLESEGSGFGTEFGFLVFVKTELISGKVTVVEFLAGSHQVENDAGQFVSSGSDGFRCTQLRSHAAVEVAQRRFAVVQRLCRHA